MTLLSRVVTPGFITWQAHMWFGYGVVMTFFSPWLVGAAVIAAGIKEFYVDKHFEVDQTFTDNLQDFAGYCAGIVLAVLAHKVLHL